jgi:hypothetical protein
LADFYALSASALQEYAIRRVSNIPAYFTYSSDADIGNAEKSVKNKATLIVSPSQIGYFHTASEKPNV